MKASIRREIGGLLAAMSMYTRLPAWRIMILEADDYVRAIQWWPIVGVLTGGAMAGTIVLLAEVLPPAMAVVIGLVVRMLLTGAFHEDGLGDICDGFGGGKSRDHILEIMKDSRVGSYAVIGYVLYFALLVITLCSLPMYALPEIAVIGDVLARCLSAQQVVWLPYARDVQTSKAGIVYSSRWPWFGWVFFLVTMGGLYALVGLYALALLAFVSLVFVYVLHYLRRRIGGYTGDTLGGLYLLLELLILIGMVVFFR